MLLDRKCPKCGGLLLYRVEETEVTRRCLCGWIETIYRERGEYVYKKVEPAARGNLPEAGSKLRVCLNTLAVLYPRALSTEGVARQAVLDKKNVSAYLMVLMHRGLVDKVTDQRGVSGGSDWKATTHALKLLKMEVPSGSRDLR